MLNKIIVAVALIASSSLWAMDLKISTLYPDGTAEVIALRQAGRDIAAATDNRVRLQVYPGGVMGDDQAVKRRIRTGQLHGALVQSGALSGDYPGIQILNAPFAFNNYQEVAAARKAFDAELEQGLLAAGLQTFGFIDGGFAYIMSQQPVASIEDLKRQRLWLPAGDTFSERVARSFDVSPILLGIGEVLTALQTGTINAIAAPATAALTLQWHTRVQHVTQLPLIYTMGTLYIDQRHFGRLSAEDQQRVNDILRAAITRLDNQSQQSNQAAFEALTNQRVRAVELSPEQTEAIRGQASRVHAEQVRNGQFSQAQLDKLYQVLADHRAR